MSRYLAAGIPKATNYYEIEFYMDHNDAKIIPTTTLKAVGPNAFIERPAAEVVPVVELPEPVLVVELPFVVLPELPVVEVLVVVEFVKTVMYLISQYAST